MRRRSVRQHRSIVLLAIMLLTSACTRAVGATNAPASAVESAAPEASPSPSTSARAIDEQALQEMLRLRKELGLRSDLEYVIAVASDPRATSDMLFIPLLPDEVATLTARAANADEVVVVATAYAAGHPNEFGGLYIDNMGGGAVVILWTANLTEHEMAIRRQLSPTASVEFRAVRYSELYLTELMQTVTSDVDWMAEIPARWLGTGVDTINNKLTMSVSSADTNAEAIVAAHYGLGDALVVNSDGTGTALIPWGEVHGRVRTAAGALPTPADYSVQARARDTRSCGSDSIGYGLDLDGEFKMPCQAGAWRIEIAAFVDDDWVVVGEGDVDVPADGLATVEIILRELPDP